MLLDFANESQKSFLTRPQVHGFSLLVTGVFYWLPAALGFVATRVKSAPKQAVESHFYLLYLSQSVNGTPCTKPILERSLQIFSRGIIGHKPHVCLRRIMMYGVAPHGIVPFSLGLMQYGDLGQFFLSPRIVTATIVKYIPVFSHMLYWGGAVEATKSEIGKVLGANGGVAAITPGGIAEMFLGWPQPGCLPDEEYTLLSDRKGRCLALQHGTTLVPVSASSLTIVLAILMPSIRDNFPLFTDSMILFYGKADCRYRTRPPYLRWRGHPTNNA